MSITTSRYLKYMVDGFYDGLVMLQEFAYVSDDELETIYALGYNYFTCGKYEEARDIFSKLTDYTPNTNHYWRALGAVNQQLKNYPDAIEAYEMAIAKAIENDEMDIVSFIYMGETHILSGETGEGIKVLEKAIKIAEENSLAQSDPRVARAKLLLRIHKLG